MKTVLIVQARMGSSRLPGKVLLPVLGKPMLAHQVDRLRNVRYADEIVVATSDDARDDAIVEFCDGYGVSVFRGAENDVLSRFAGAAGKYQADIVVRLTADCPLIDPAIVDQVIACYLEDPGARLYVSNTLERSFPRGMDAEVFSRALLDEADRHATSKYDREHVTPFLIRNDRADVIHRNVGCWKNLSAFRFTLDYQKDYTQISRLLESKLPDFAIGTLMRHAEELGLDWHDNDELVQVKSQSAVAGLGKRPDLLRRFGLGTAQFGMYYGRFNRAGVPSKESVCAILENAAKLGLCCIDTAHLYGESEAVLGYCSSALPAFSIVTKTPRFPDRNIGEEDAQILRDAFETSLRLMGQPVIEGLLIHHSPNLLADGGEFLYQEMVRLKDEGLVKRIGVSAYSGEIVEQILELFDLDFVQLPINLLDRRLIESGSLGRISRSGVKIHARSAFLQGLLLAAPDSLSGHFQPVRKVLEDFHAAAGLAGVSPAQAALHYLLKIPEIEKIVVGIESLKQLEEIFSNFPEEVDMDYEKFRIDQPEILNPVLWVS